jgi:hypothetical protein
MCSIPALADDCRRAAVLISSLPVTGPCPGPRVIDAHDLWEKGAQTISFGEDARSGGSAAAPLRVETVAEGRGARPWAPVRHRRELIAPAPSEPEITASSGKDAESASGSAGAVAASQ